MKKSTKTPQTPLFCVTTYSTFRHRYLVQAETAADAERYVSERVTNGDGHIEEWQQLHLGEFVGDVVTRSLTMDEAKHEHAANESESGCPWVPVERLINTDWDKDAWLPRKRSTKKAWYKDADDREDAMWDGFREGRIKLPTRLPGEVE